MQVSEGLCGTVVYPPGQWYHKLQTVSTCSWLKATTPDDDSMNSVMLAGDGGPYGSGESFEWWLQQICVHKLQLAN